MTIDSNESLTVISQLCKIELVAHAEGIGEQAAGERKVLDTSLFSLLQDVETAFNGELREQTW